MDKSVQSLDAAAILRMIHEALSSGSTALLLHRLHCVLCIAHGRSAQEVADWFSLDSRTLRRWLRSACMQGIEGLREHHHGGRPAKLTKDQVISVGCDLRASPISLNYPERRWTGKRLALHLARRYSVRMSVRNCQRMIALCSGRHAKSH